MAKLNIIGLKCDVCDYRDNSIKVEDYDKYINKPCPKCGQPLLTQADYDNIQLLIKITNKINKNPILRFLDFFFKNKKYKIEMNGTGNLNIKKDIINKV